MIHVLEAAAITLVFTQGTLFVWVRKLWPAFFSCPLCVGVWVGIGYSGMLSPPITSSEGLQVLGSGALAGVVALGIHAVLDILEALADRLDR